MEPASSSNVKIPLDRNRDHYISSLIEGSAASSIEAAANMTATAISLPSTNNQLVLYTERPQFSSTTSVGSVASQPSHAASTSSSSSTSSAPIEKLSRPMAFDKVKEKHFFHAFFHLLGKHESWSCISITLLPNASRNMNSTHMCLYHIVSITLTLAVAFLFHKKHHNYFTFLHVGLCDACDDMNRMKTLGEIGCEKMQTWYF